MKALNQNSKLKPLSPYLSIDIWRGLAALLVVMYHGSMQFIDSGNQEYLKYIPYYIAHHGYLGVAIFFVISGYCIMGAAISTLNGGKGVLKFALDRIWRIYPPYLFVIITAILMSICSTLLGFNTGKIPKAVDLKNSEMWLSNITLTHFELNQPAIVSVSWSLCYEIAFYFLIFIIILLSNSLQSHKSKSIKLLINITYITTLVSLLWIILSPKSCPFPLNLWYQFGFGAIIYVFLFCKENTNEMHYFKYSGIALIIAVALIGIHATQFYLLDDELKALCGCSSSTEKALISLIFGCILLILYRYDTLLISFLAFRPLLIIGTYSYSLYLTHMLLIPIFYSKLTKLGLVGKYYWITFSFIIFITVFFGWLFFLLVESRFISFRHKKRVESELLSND